MNCGENVIRKPLIGGFCLVLFIYTHITSNQLVFVYKKKTKNMKLCSHEKKRFGAFCGVNNNLIIWLDHSSATWTPQSSWSKLRGIYISTSWHSPPPTPTLHKLKGIYFNERFPTRWIGRNDPQTCHLSIFIFGSCHATCSQRTHQKCAASIKHRIQEPIASVTPETPQNVWRELEYHLYVRRATNGADIELR